MRYAYCALRHDRFGSMASRQPSGDHVGITPNRVGLTASAGDRTAIRTRNSLAPGLSANPQKRYNPP